jgi:MoxR-like ATPase
MLARALSSSVGCSFKRIQCTPDLLPNDITGSSVFNPKTTEFEFQPGPLFAQTVLADEINRATPRAQSALLEAMAERKVTVDGTNYDLSPPFFLIATQNPIDHEGTFPLPEAQLDRFLLEVHLDYPSESEEREIARRTTSGPLPELEPVVTLDDLRQIGAFVPRVPATDEAVSLAVRIARASRPGAAEAPSEITEYVRYGAGPRGSQALVLAAKARAALRGEPVADVEDIVAVALPGLRHRLVLSYRAEVDGVSDVDLVNAVLKRVGSK